MKIGDLIYVWDHSTLSIIEAHFVDYTAGKKVIVNIKRNVKHLAFGDRPAWSLKVFKFYGTNREILADTLSKKFGVKVK